jgi:hypothetical protein
VCSINSRKVNAADDNDDDDNNNNNSIQFFTYLHDELINQGPITESVRIQNNNTPEQNK